MRYREGIARTSGETNFSGVHKDSLAACGPGARARRVVQRRASRAPIRELFTRKNLIKYKIASGNKNISSPIQQGEVSSL